MIHGITKGGVKMKDDFAKRRQGESRHNERRHAKMIHEMTKENVKMIHDIIIGGA